MLPVVSILHPTLLPCLFESFFLQAIFSTWGWRLQRWGRITASRCSWCQAQQQNMTLLLALLLLLSLERFPRVFLLGWCQNRHPHGATPLGPASGKDAPAPVALHAHIYLLGEERVRAMHRLTVKIRATNFEWKRASGSHCRSWAGLALSLNGVTWQLKQIQAVLQRTD